MTEPDNEFDDFLARRKPVFRRSADDPFEPPEELDRIVLRQARDAIEREQPERHFQAPRWAMPVALAASLLLVFTVVLRVGVATKAPLAEVTVRNISQEIEDPMAAPEPMAPMVAPRDDRGITPGGFASEGESTRYAPAPPPPPQVASNRARADEPPAAGAVQSRAPASSTVVMSAPPPSEAERAVASKAPTPAFRGNAASWLAEIDRLRAAGKAAEADAELAEYKREHRAYAGTPDR